MIWIVSHRRNKQVIIFQLRAGHCGLRHNLYQKLKIDLTGLFACSKEQETPHLMLQSCQLHYSLGQRTLPDPSSCGRSSKLMLNCNIYKRDCCWHQSEWWRTKRTMLISTLINVAEGANPISSSKLKKDLHLIINKMFLWHLHALQSWRVSAFAFIGHSIVR